MEYAVSLGSVCGQLLGGVVEYMREENDEVMLTAARSLGAYGTLLDHAYELNHDLTECSRTYATEMVDIYGDSPSVRKEARETLLEEAKNQRKQGEADLSPRQMKIFRGLTRLYDVRYKLMVDFRDRQLAQKTYKDSWPVYSQ